jgi:MSHA pilin protein MshC
MMLSSRVRINFKSGSGGFTILELIIVIIILGVLAVSVGYKIFSTSDTSSIVGTDQVIADIQYIQTLAMASMAQKSIIFTGGSNTYNMAGETRRMPGDAVAGNTVTFAFNSLGEPVTGADGTLTIGAKQVKVWAVTGKVEEL